MTVATTDTIETKTHASRRTRGLARAALILTGVLGLTGLAAQVGPGSEAHAASGLRYQRGYSVQNGWLCYGWSNGTYHCTQHWRVSNGHYISGNPTWVPSSGSAAPVVYRNAAGGQPARSSSGVVQGSTSAGEPCRSTQYFVSNISQWAVPPSCYSGIYAINPANYVYRSGFGWCNWWPEVMNPSRPDLLWGRYPRGTAPRPGATVVFAPGVQGAGGGGHYGRVVAVAPGGNWFLISEMNFYWRGGGWQKVSYRYVHVGSGISFIY